MKSKPEDCQILDVCLDLHMSASGASDPLSDEDLDRMRAWLELRVQNWRHDHSGFSQRFDDAVYLVCRAALEDASRDKHRRTVWVERAEVKK